ncbi:MAG: preprotein translocase subunit SecA [Armatimonadota bacterium]
MVSLIKRVFGQNERALAALQPCVDQINELEPEIERLSDDDLRARTEAFRERVQEHVRPFHDELDRLKRERGQMVGSDERQRKEYEIERAETTLKQETKAILDELLVEAFAVAREGSKRVLGMRPFDVQLIGGMVLHEGRVAEMKTGEGKTLTATLPMYLNALTGRGVHLVTTNDFLVRWQAEWMGKLFEFLGLTVGHIQHGMRSEERRAMYTRDVTYVENSELGFDYLRDNMAGNPERLVLRDLYFAIIDEVDSILIDEARTPLIISGTPEQSEQFYEEIERIVRRLKGTREQPEEGPDGRKIEPDADFWVDEKFHQVTLTEEGQSKVEKALRIDNLEHPEYIEIKHHIQNSLKAHGLYHRDHDYVIKDGEVMIVDEFTGHLQPGRRYSDGLHQAIEAKEGVRIQQARQTVASITYQNFFKLYDKLAGMTGTAKTEEDEFRSTYGMPVVMIPTNRPVVREDHPDVVYKTEEAKYRGVVDEIIDCYVREQPVLVGSRSVEVSELIGARLTPERLSLHAMARLGQFELHDGLADVSKDQREELLETLRAPIPQIRRSEVVRALRELGLKPEPLERENLERLLQIIGTAEDERAEEEHEHFLERLENAIGQGIPHNILNAKQHEREGQIIADAGRAGAVTIATNMAGRGVDIVLGGASDEGERNEEQYKRVKQIGGLHILGSERHESRRIDNQLRGRSGRQGDPGSSRFYVSLEDELMRLFAPDRFGMLMGGWPEEEAIEARLVSKSIENAQEKVEARNFDIRKNTLKYDDVMNVQRALIYEQRRRVLEGEDLREPVLEMVDSVVEHRVDTFGDPELPARWANQIEDAFMELERGEDEITEESVARMLRNTEIPGIENALPAADLLELDPFERRNNVEQICQGIWLRRYHMSLDEGVPGLSAAVEIEELADGNRERQKELAKERAREIYRRKEEAVGAELMREIERSWLLRIIDRRWMQHLKDMDFLREGIHLRAYGQHDPVIEYTREAHTLFEALLQSLAEDLTQAVLLTEVATERHDVSVQGMEAGQAQAPDAAQLEAQQAGESVETPMTQAADQMTERGHTYVAGDEPGRNDPCPCGSGLKYKQCCIDKAGVPRG